MRFMSEEGSTQLVNALENVTRELQDALAGHFSVKKSTNPNPNLNPNPNP